MVPSKRLKMVRLLPVIIIISIFNLNISAQELNISSESKIYVHGTSTLHDWTSEAELFLGKINADLSNNSLSISSLSFKVKAESIESGKSKMNSLTYEALKSEKHPYIEFQMTDFIKTDGNKVFIKGNLTLAGVKKSIDLKGTFIKENQELKIFGTRKINMTHYSIEPPTAMFGTIVVGEEVEIEYNLRMKL